MAIALPLIVPAGEALFTAAAYVGSAILAAAGIHAVATAIDQEFSKDASTAANTCPQAITQRPPPECAELVARIEARISELKQRYEEMLADRHGLFEARPNPVGHFGSWPGHLQQYRGQQTNLARLMAQAQAKRCPVPADAEEWATRPPPGQPRKFGGPA